MLYPIKRQSIQKIEIIPTPRFFGIYFILRRKDKMKKIRVLHKWPLSRVELVEINDKRFVLKTIHKDFINEIYRQKILRNTCRKIKIPKIYWIKKTENEASYLMDYIPHKPNKPNKNVLTDMILRFHEETRNLRSKHFKTYNFEVFYKDFLKIKKYLKSSLKNKKRVKNFFSPIFNSPYSIVHGDWGNDQILGKKGEYFMVDFGKSYYGPSILDFENPSQKDKSLNLKVKLVSIIINLAWLDLCKREYIDYDYEKEIGKKIREFRKIEQKIR